MTNQRSSKQPNPANDYFGLEADDLDFPRRSRPVTGSKEKQRLSQLSSAEGFPARPAARRSPSHRRGKVPRGKITVSGEVAILNRFEVFCNEIDKDRATAIDFLLNFYRAAQGSSET